jgi:hypothetical protein
MRHTLGWHLPSVTAAFKWVTLAESDYSVTPRVTLAESDSDSDRMKSQYDGLSNPVGQNLDCRYPRRWNESVQRSLSWHEFIGIEQCASKRISVHANRDRQWIQLFSQNRQTSRFGWHRRWSRLAASIFASAGRSRRIPHAIPGKVRRGPLTHRSRVL